MPAIVAQRNWELLAVVGCGNATTVIKRTGNYRTCGRVKKETSYDGN
jgi:hypothetical protein